MGRKYDTEDEEYEEEEEIELTHDEILMKRLDKQIDKLQQKLEELEVNDEEGSKRYSMLTRNIKELEEIQESIQRKNTEKSSQEESDKRIQAMSENKIMSYIQMGLTIGTPFLTEFMKQRFNSRNVDKVTKYEEEGGIVNSKAIKFVK